MCAYVCVTESHRAGDKQFGCYGMRGVERERERESEEETSIVRQERSIFRESQTSKYASFVCMRVCAWVYAYTLARTYAAQTGYSNVSPVVGRDLWRA